MVHRQLDRVESGLPQAGERPLAADLGQVLGQDLDGRRCHRHLGQRTGTAHIVDGPLVGQVLVNADQVAALPLVESFKDRLHNDAVATAAEGVGSELLDDDRDAVGRVLHHAGEDDALALRRSIGKSVERAGAHAASSVWMS